ncbi:MAG: hypothetical protein ACRC68_08990, partial [Clostridium sp.]
KDYNDNYNFIDGNIKSLNINGSLLESADKSLEGDDKSLEGDDKILESADKSLNSNDITENSKDKEIIIMNYLKENRKVSTNIAIDLVGLKTTASKNLLKKMVSKGLLKAEGNGKARCYILNDDKK